MEKEKIIKTLDEKFNVYSIVDAWQSFEDLINPIEEHCTSSFLEYYSGLMIDYCTEVNEILVTTFITENVFRYIEEEGMNNVLIFTHHPFYHNPHDYSFENHIKNNLDVIENNRVSIYSCHLPLDISKSHHSTDYYLADKLMKEIKGSISAYHEPVEREISCGYYGKCKENLFKELREINNQFKIYKSLDKEPEIISCVPGGGNEIEFIKEAKDLGADTYITGIIDMRGKNSISGNINFLKKVKELEINLIGLGHYHTEALAMRGLVNDYFKETFKCSVLYFSDPYYE
ncbi:MAG: Nif3-like dinuclear metal center hexameric protein [Halanaerobiales bacterium]